MDGLDSLLLINCVDILTEIMLVLWSFFYSFLNKRLYLLEAFRLIKHPRFGSRASIRSLTVTVYIQVIPSTTADSQ